MAENSKNTREWLSGHAKYQAPKLIAEMDSSSDSTDQQLIGKEIEPENIPGIFFSRYPAALVKQMEIARVELVTTQRDRGFYSVWCKKDDLSVLTSAAQRLYKRKDKLFIVK